MADYFFDEEESNENIEVKDDIYNYKGYFVENEDEEEKKFYEFGAHFPYMYLYQRLEILAQEREEQQKDLEKKLIENEKESRDDPATNEESKPNENLKDLLSTFQQKGKSRNRGDVGIGLTYMPQMNKKNSNQINIENIGINLIKSTAGQPNQNENKNLINITVNKNKKSAIINNFNSRSNQKNNNCANRKEKTKSKIKKNSKLSNKQIKIRKRNDNNFLNINNSLNNNTFNINILNTTKFGEKINPKNMTHDIPFASKIKNNLVEKLKSIQYSKEKLRKQILNTGNIEQRLNTKIKMNIALNKYRNGNNKWSYSKCYGIQNTKNASSSKNVLSKEKNKKKLINSKKGITSAHQQIKKGIIIENRNKSNKNSNISSHNNILNNNIKSIKENNYIQNIKNKNIILHNNPSIKKYNNKISQTKIPNNNANYKSLLNNKMIVKPFSGQRKKNMEFIENLGQKKSKNNISRNNNMPFFNNPSQNNTNKNFHSVNNAYNNKYIKNIKSNTNQIHINLNNNLTQQLNPKISNKLKEKNSAFNKISISNASLQKYTPSSGIQKKITELNFNKNKKSDNIKKKINIINIQEKIKNYLNKKKDVKSAINLNEKNKNINKAKNISLFKNNYFINRNKNNNNIYGNKNIISRNRNNNNSNEKFNGKTNNTLLQNKKKQHININININNQHNIILNKMNSGINNNSTNLCSVRSSDNKGILNIKKERSID